MRRCSMPLAGRLPLSVSIWTRAPGTPRWSTPATAFPAGCLPVALVIIGHTFVAWRMRRRWLSETQRAASAVNDAKHAAYQLHRAQQRLNNVIDSTGVGLWELNVVTGKVTVNAQWAAMLGYTLEELESPAPGALQGAGSSGRSCACGGGHPGDHGRHRAPARRRSAHASQGRPLDLDSCAGLRG